MTDPFSPHTGAPTVRALAVAPQLAWSEADSTDDIQARYWPYDNVASADRPRREVQVVPNDRFTADDEPMRWYRRPGVLFGVASVAAVIAGVGLIVVLRTDAVDTVPAGTTGSITQSPPAHGNQAPGGQIPGGPAPVGQLPGGQMPAGPMPGNKIPSGQVPSGQSRPPQNPGPQNPAPQNPAPQKPAPVSPEGQNPGPNPACSIPFVRLPGCQSPEGQTPGPKNPVPAPGEPLPGAQVLPPKEPDLPDEPVILQDRPPADLG